MDVIKISFIGVAAVLLSVFFKQGKSEYSLYVTLVAAIIIFFYITSKVKIITDNFNLLNSYLDTRGDYLKVLLKMIGITYISEFSAALCKDTGHGAIATQIEIFSRISILIIALPIIKTLLEKICSL